jgi:type IX secretion system PorP/SprF family membrane protein
MIKQCNAYLVNEKCYHKVVYAFAFILLQCPASAQQEWNYSQYLFNLYDINTAYAGNHNAPSFAFRIRSQWMGMDGAPLSQQLSVHTPIKDNFGAGVRLLNESIGLRNQQTLRISGAYKLRFKNKTLSFGLATGVFRQTIKQNNVIAQDPNDQQLMQNNTNKIQPLVDASIFFNTDKAYAGIECARMNRFLSSSDENVASLLTYQMNITAGYFLKVNNNNLVQFSTLVKMTEGKLWQAELNALFLKDNKYWFGAGYRYPTSGQLMGCININPQWRFGLSYDIPFSALALQSNGSAEAFLGFNLKSSSTKSIRYF